VFDETPKSAHVGHRVSRNAESWMKPNATHHILRLKYSNKLFAASSPTYKHKLTCACSVTSFKSLIILESMLHQKTKWNHTNCLRLVKHWRYKMPGVYRSRFLTFPSPVLHCLKTTIRTTRRTVDGSRVYRNVYAVSFTLLVWPLFYRHAVQHFCLRAWKYSGWTKMSANCCKAIDLAGSEDVLKTRVSYNQPCFSNHCTFCSWWTNTITTSTSTTSEFMQMSSRVFNVPDANSSRRFLCGGPSSIHYSRQSILGDQRVKRQFRLDMSVSHRHAFHPYQ